MLFRDRQSMQSDLCHTPKISRRFGLQCCDPKENRIDHLPVLIETISRHLLSRHLTYTFPGKLRSDIPL